MTFIEQSWYVVVFCLAIFAIVFMLRKILEFFAPSLLSSGTKFGKFYTEVLLPILPVFLGGLSGGIFSSYPYPEMFTSFIAHVFFGLFCGLISGLVYRVIKAGLLKKIGDNNDE